MIPVLFKFKLIAVEGEDDFEQPVQLDAQRRRIIPRLMSSLRCGNVTGASAHFAALRTNYISTISFRLLKGELH